MCAESRTMSKCSRSSTRCSTSSRSPVQFLQTTTFGLPCLAYFPRFRWTNRVPQSRSESVFIGGQYGRPAITNASQSRYYWPVEVLAITNSSERQDLLAHRIEVDPPLLHIRNIAQMRSLRRAMPDQHVAIGPFAGAHALQEVAHMVL